MRKTFIAIIFLVLSYISMTSADNKNTFDVYTKMSEPALTKLLEDELKEHDIAYSKRNSGEIWYEHKNQISVSKLLKKIISSDLPANRSINYAQPFSMNLFINQLKSKQIPYEVKIRNGRTWIVWNKKNAPEVAAIRKFVDDETNEYFTRQMLKKLAK